LHIRVGVRLRKKKPITSFEFRIVKFGYSGDSFIATDSKLNNTYRCYGSRFQEQNIQIPTSHINSN